MTTIEIKFGKSVSQNYSSALSLAKQFLNFTESKDRNSKNIVVITVEEASLKLKLLESLINIIQSWVSTEISIDNKVIEVYKFNYNLSNMIECYNEHERASLKNLYCSYTGLSQGWGCRLLTKIKLNDHDDYYNPYYENKPKYWYEYGHFEEAKRWVIDKETIRNVLENNALETTANVCSFFHMENIDSKISSLPDFIDLDNSQEWEIVYEKQNSTGITKELTPIKIRRKLNKENTGNYGGLSARISLNFGLDENADSRESIQSKSRYIPEVSFLDIGGIDSVINKIREIIELPIKHPEIYQHLGIRPHKGILLYGDPGNGKTLIAKAIANEVKAHFIPISGPELISKWHGQSEENLRNVFIEARNFQPSIIFFDEIDSVAQQRTDEENLRIDSKFVNQLLTLMDGIESYGNVTILATTNRPELIDNALLRPGRFDFKIEIPHPDEIGCFQILKICTRKVPLDHTLDINKVVPHLVGCSGAEIAHIVKEAAMRALNRKINITEIIRNKNTDFDYKSITVNYNDFVTAIKEFKHNKLAE